MDELYITLIVFTCIHCCLYFFDTIFKTCSHLPYLYFLKNTGLRISPFKIEWFTTAFNRIIQKWGSVRKKLQLAWFTTGTWFVVVLLPFAVWLVFRSMYYGLKEVLREDKSGNFDESDGAILQPMFPGYNLPLSDMGYYMLTLMITTTFHEMGHAISAVREDIHINGVGFILFFIIPFAYVQLEQLESLPATKQLRILCAGVWHNIVLVILASITITVLPWLLYPIYDSGIGVQVQELSLDSPLRGSLGLSVKDRIVQLNQCSVFNEGDWLHCLMQTYKEPSPGFCIHSEFIKEHDESIPAKHLAGGAVECCNSNSPRHLCFEYLETETEPLELPQHSCLNVRTVVEVSKELCHLSDSEITNGLQNLGQIECSFGYHCFRPSLENATKLIVIKRADAPVVIYLGHPLVVFQTVKVSDYISLYNILPSDIPEAIERMCQYIVMFSSGLAVINIIPCFNFDGQHIIKALMDILLSKKIKHSSVRHAIALCVTIVGTVILILYLIIMVWARL